MCLETSIKWRKLCDNTVSPEPLTISSQNFIPTKFLPWRDNEDEVSSLNPSSFTLKMSFFFFVVEYCGTRAIPNVETSDYLLTLGSKLNPKINIMWTGNVLFLRFCLPLVVCFNLLIFELLLSTCAVSFSSVGEGHWFLILLCLVEGTVAS